MKKWYLVSLALLVLALAACSDGSSDDGLVHYGDLILDGGGTIPIYKTAAVTDAQMPGVVATVQAGYDGLGANKFRFIPSKVSAIWIDTADNFNDLGSNKWIIKVKFDNDSSQMIDVFQFMVDTKISVPIFKDTIRLVYFISAKAKG